MAISLFANVESGIRFGVLAATWAGIPAVSFSLATFMLERWLKAQAGAKPASEAKPATAVVSATVSPVKPVAKATPATTPGATGKPSKTRQRGASGPDIEKRARGVLARQPDVSGAGGYPLRVRYVSHRAGVFPSSANASPGQRGWSLATS